MIKRILSAKISRYARQYPVVTVTGPRQSGKTTLCKALFPGMRYVSLEDLDVRSRARRDPRGFLGESAGKGVILDEIQRLPELLSYIQTLVDQNGRPGQFIVTGSQNFELLNSVTQTLAGRTALATLLPFSFDEIYGQRGPGSIDQMLFTGFYPRIHDKKLPPSEALSFYVSTYLERDIRALIHVKELAKFELFLKLCASRTGQILNMANLANDCGINHNTAKSWLSVLESSYIIHFVRPHHKNFRKRLVKSPKLYFIDTGLAAYLLDIHGPGEIASHPLKGALFETFVVSDIFKHFLNRGLRENLFYFRDNVGNEVDLILDRGGKILPMEIKMSQTITGDFFKGLNYYTALNPKNSLKPLLICGSNTSHPGSNNTIVSYKEISKFL